MNLFIADTYFQQIVRQMFKTDLYILGMIEDLDFMIVSSQ